MIPWPREVVPAAGSFELGAATTIHAPGLEALAERLRAELRPATGLALPDGARGGDQIRLALDAALPAEGYTLIAAEDGVAVAGGTPAGVSHGLQALRQLLPAEVFGSVPARVPWRIPCLRITDAPRLGWRGAMLDVARHFMPVDFVLRFVDLLAMHRLNTLHLHLTDDQGWRVQIDGHPRLTEVGGRDGFYTKAELRAIVAHAAVRHVTVLPEIEMPGHAQAAIAAYPELGRTGAPVEVMRRSGVSEHALNARPETLAFCRDVLEEVVDLFPGERVHVGADECAFDGWPLGEVAALLAEHGRGMVAWDEVLETGVPCTVMAWRGIERGVAAARRGLEVVMAPESHTYFDHYQSADRSSEPPAIGGLTTLEDVLAFDPVPAELGREEAARVLGTQCQLWTEYMPTPAHVEYMAFPRLCAFAEVAWSGRPGGRGFLDRLPDHLERLDRLGVDRRP